MDLGACTRDRVDPHAVLTWLRAARGAEDEEAFGKPGAQLRFYVQRAATPDQQLATIRADG